MSSVSAHLLICGSSSPPDPPEQWQRWPTPGRTPNCLAQVFPWSGEKRQSLYPASLWNGREHLYLAAFLSKENPRILVRGMLHQGRLSHITEDL